MMGDRSRLKNFMENFIGIVRFRNDHFGAIMGYGDYVIGDSVISRVYNVEGLRNNLFSVRQFCDSNLEVTFRKHSCYVRDTDGVELTKGSHGSNLYIISVEDMMKSSLICLLSKASKNKSWLWHRRLNHLNFGTINDLARKDLVHETEALTNGHVLTPDVPTWTPSALNYFTCAYTGCPPWTPSALNYMTCAYTRCPSWTPSALNYMTSAPLVVRGCDGGGVTVVAAVVVVRVAAARVRASGYGGWIDPVMGSDFGLGRKCPPEKFSGGGGMVVAGIRWWPAVGCRK
ncbi:integrase, catalytic region, zinc finger, CCHC-type containing protein [Tanacetum coccineum]